MIWNKPAARNNSQPEGTQMLISVNDKDRLANTDAIV
jgi:hypothetical protein